MLIQNGVIDPEKQTVLFCAAGGRSALATKTLKEMGYLFKRIQEDKNSIKIQIFNTKLLRMFQKKI